MATRASGKEGAVAEGRRGGEPLPRSVEPGLRTTQVEPAGQEVTPIMLLVNGTRPVLRHSDAIIAQQVKYLRSLLLILVVGYLVVGPW